MQFEKTSIAGLYIVTPEKQVDERGYFMRTFCTQSFKEQDIDFHVRQCSISFNAHSGTLRGMHSQREPKAEAKLVRCVAGSVYDVVIDLRRTAPSYLQWFGVELSAGIGNALFIPPGCAHGFITLEDRSRAILPDG